MDQIWPALWTCLVIALASSSISLTLTQTELFAPLRALAARIHPMIGHLAHCFYCTSHWVVIAGIAIYQPTLVSSGTIVVDLIVSTFVTVSLATYMSGLSFAVFLGAMAKGTREQALKRSISAS